MQVIEFSLTLNINEELINASCQKFQVAKVPQIRVAFKISGIENVYTFYEIKEWRRRFFFYPLNSKKFDHIGNIIENVLMLNKKAKMAMDEIPNNLL